MSMRKLFTLVLACAALPLAPAVAQLKTEELNIVELKDHFQPHWVWVNDISFSRMADGRAYLIDGDTGEFLGMISSGYAHGVLQISPGGASFVVPGTFLSRHSRGTRTDVVTFYSAKTLEPGQEVEIPTKRLQSLPLLSAMPLTDDGRFSLIYNFTPEQSITVVDLAERKLVGEYPTAGCGLLYPTGARSFFMQCADGSLQNATLDAAGAVTLGGASAPLFQEKDPSLEKPVRLSTKQWALFTPGNVVAIVNGAGKIPSIVARWSLTSAAEKDWRIGGIQPVAYHAPSNRLFVLMHRGGDHTHKDPGTELWVFDMKTHALITRFPLAKPATSVAISDDVTPLLYLTMFGMSELTVADPASGKVLRTVTGLGDALTVIQPALTSKPPVN